MMGESHRTLYLLDCILRIAGVIDDQIVGVIKYE